MSFTVASTIMPGTKCSIFLLSLALMTSIARSISPDPQAIPGITISMYTKIRSPTAVLEPKTIDAISNVFGNEIVKACEADKCELKPSNVLVTVGSVGTENIDGDFMFGIEINVILRSNVQSMMVKHSTRLSKSNMQHLLRENVKEDFELLAFMPTYRMDSDRSAECGDGILHPDEVCDDDNVVDNDGCSSSCLLEDGYMCFGAWRDPLSPATRGKMTLWEVDWENVARLAILDADETCLASDVDLRDDRMFDSSLLEMTYANKTFPMAPTPLPPPGYFSRRFCSETFPVPEFYKFDGGCALMDV